MQASDSNFYGTTELGGQNDEGTVFKITPTGGFTTFYNFAGTDGSAAACGLIQASDGDLYGTTYEGGVNNACPNGCGTVFKLSLDGTLTTLHSFDGTDGANPIAGLIQATDGSFYGTTYGGGSEGWGTVFQITSAGAVTTLHSFLGTDGAQPYGPVMQFTKGNLYGTSTNGSVTGVDGTAFTAMASLHSFVTPVQTAGRDWPKHRHFLVRDWRVRSRLCSMEFPLGSASGPTRLSPLQSSLALRQGFISVTTIGGTFKSNVRFRVVK